MGLVDVLLLVLLLALSATFSGSETGMYSVSRVQLDDLASRGRWSARVVRRLLRNDTAVLIALLIGNNLMLELLTHRFDGVVPERLPPWAHEITVAAVLTPIVFFAGELLPKDLFRRRPLRLLLAVSPLLAIARVVFLPLSWPILQMSKGLERLFGLRADELEGALRREEMLEILQEGTRVGALQPTAETLARNALVLRETPVRDVMVPWSRVKTVDFDAPDEEVRAATLGSDHTRLPALSRRPVSGPAAGAGAPESGGARNGDGSAGPRGEGGAGQPRVVGYVHLLDLLGRNLSVADSLRPMPSLDPDAPVDRGLARLRLSGQRLALVGSYEVPLGLVTLMDLVEVISRQSRTGP